MLQSATTSDPDAVPSKPLGHLHILQQSATLLARSSNRVNPEGRETAEIIELLAADQTADESNVTREALETRNVGEQTNAQEWRELVEALPQIVWIARPDGYHVYFNQQWVDFTGLTLAESIGDGWNPPFHVDERPLARQLWAEATRTGAPYEIEYRLRRHDGVYRWMLGRALPLRKASGEIEWWFGTCTDIEELKVALADAAALREELERRATHDPLTGLANRALLFERMDTMLRQCRRTGLAVVFLDLDWFKQVNDRLGHRAGDHLLVHVADCLRAAVREGDVVARIGGDEFVVVGQADDDHDAQRLGQRLAEAVRGPLRLGDEQVNVSASVGVSYVDATDVPDADVVLASADDRMYQAKHRR